MTEPHLPSLSKKFAAFAIDSLFLIFWVIYWIGSASAAYKLSGLANGIILFFCITATIINNYCVYFITQGQIMGFILFNLRLVDFNNELPSFKKLLLNRLMISLPGIWLILPWIFLFLYYSIKNLFHPITGTSDPTLIIFTVIFCILIFIQTTIGYTIFDLVICSFLTHAKFNLSQTFHDRKLGLVVIED
jgi:hypothetical protein